MMITHPIRHQMIFILQNNASERLLNRSDLVGNGLEINIHTRNIGITPSELELFFCVHKHHDRAQMHGHIETQAALLQFRKWFFNVCLSFWSNFNK
jgi:hypothetical protein